MRKHILAAFVLAFSSTLVWAKKSENATAWKTTTLELPNTMALGQTLSKETVYLGGLSGLTFSHQKKNNLYFWAVTDRGPNAEPYFYAKGAQASRPFLLPDYQPRIVQLVYNMKKKSVRLEKQILLKTPEGKNLTGLPNLNTSSDQSHQNEPPTTILGQALALDPYGLDIEGISTDQNGNFWLVDEYGPSIVQFDRHGTLLERFVPFATDHQNAHTVQALPTALRLRKMNRGFEAVSIVGDRLFAVLQSPLPTKKDNSNSIRVIEFDLKQKKTVGVYVYLMDNVKKADKIGGLTPFGKHQFLIIERDGKASEDSIKRIYKIDLAKASNLLNQQFSKIDINSTDLEKMSKKQLQKNQIKVIDKQLYLDLRDVHLNNLDKYEGIAFVKKENSVFLLNDNDFGIDGIFDAKTGKLNDGTQLFKSLFIHVQKKDKN